MSHLTRKRRDTSRTARRSRRLQQAIGALLGVSLVASPALAKPEDGTVVAGQATISSQDQATIINQLTNKAIIDWGRFGINPNEIVRFIQPSQMAVILNRVTGGDPSIILGQMQANGTVFLLNPNGIIFGPGSQINVGSLVASTLSMTNDDFMSGNYRLTQDMTRELAAVINQGTITVTPGGFAILAAPMVSNEGVIVANLGKVVLGSTQEMTINFDGRDLISYSLKGLDGQPGTVVVPRDTVSEMLAQVITNPAVVDSGSMVQNADGSISLVGAEGLTFHNGTIQTLGADGQPGGSVELRSGQSTVVGPNALIDASGAGVGSDGGSIKLLSEGLTATYPNSRLVSRGGITGDGGFVETSGKNVWLRGTVDVGAAGGEAGTYLIDPRFLTIINGSGGSLDPLALSNTTNQPAPGALSASISEQYLESFAVGTMILQADDTTTINDIADGAITMQPGVSVTFLTGTGNLIFADPSDIVRVSGGGSLTTNIGQDLYLGQFEVSGTGSLNVTVGRDIIDQNGAAANLVADRITLSGNVGTLANPIDVAGVTNPTYPQEIRLNAAHHTVSQF
ncbi:MAG: filamentous hemagglutinin N-terminal domain-containing protein, partial [Candidatus Eremiobacterota bacterium]